ncbi:diacylglycerol kinase family protein [Muricauda sp. 334s03]|uniref:Diacylglycerol kinase family protein n=2 Tax=Flagellimonas TaxID=444459 RepID=A0ABT5XNK8_9FLAO|nr:MULTISPECIES: diacylglycerol kinase family protein [Allomuricauda]MDF0707459.1 diacylglycerol kinase family protein [[Muricauda] okinawensis]MDF0715360.1 diacylglycerol kinase family protein [[Muricauda] yonaguniensis]
MKLLFVVNPISGGVDKEPFLKKAKTLCKKYGIDHHIFKTTGKDDQIELKKVVQTFKPDRVVSVGGDGTTLFTSISLLDFCIPMGIIPLGSANGMATELSVNPEPMKALKDVILSNVIGSLDMLLVNDAHYCIHIGDIGINAQIVDSYEKDKNRGMATYAKYFLQELKNLTPFGVTLNINGKEIREKALMVGICNSRKYGTGVPLNVTGNPMDGIFEIVIVNKIDANSLIKAGLSKFDESFHDSQNGKVLNGDSASILFEEPRLLQLDGEVIGHFKEIKVKILKGAVKLITHNENTYVNS